MKKACSQSARPSAKVSARPGAAEPIPAKAWASLLGAVEQIFYWEDPAVPEGIAFQGDARRMLGLSKERLAGGRAEWLKQVHPDDLTRVRGGLAAAGKGQPQSLEYRYRRPGHAAVWLKETICPVRDSKTGRWLLAGVLADVSEDRCMGMQLRHFQKMSAFGELAGSVAHDFNNLLTLFQGYTELLQIAAKPGGASCGYLNEMAGAVERARELTSQLHRFSRRKPGNGPEAVEMAGFLKELHRMLRRLMGERIEWALSLNIRSGWVMADPVLLESLLVNLAVNASEAMPKGGRIGVKLDEVNIGPRNRRVVAGGWRPGPYLRLAVSDTGEGIRKADLERIFKPGFTTRGSCGAEGLGLSTCQGIVNECGGAMGVRSTPGKGSLFQVFLPAIPPPSAKSSNERADAQAPIPAGKGEKILVVEDDAITRKALVAMVRKLGYRVQSASNGDAAWHLLKNDRKIRLVISDIIMPLMGGGELVELVESRRPDVRFILISGYTTKPPTYINHVHTVFLPKPLQSRVLANHLRKLLDV